MQETEKEIEVDRDDDEVDEVNAGLGNVPPSRPADNTNKMRKDKDMKVPNIKKYLAGIRKDKESRRNDKTGLDSICHIRPADNIDLEREEVEEDLHEIRKIKSLDKGNEIAKEEVMIKNQRKDVMVGEKEKEELKPGPGSKQVLKSITNSKFCKSRGPYSLSSGKPSGKQRGTTTRRAPGVRKVKNPGTRDIKEFFTKLRTRHEEAIGPKILVNIFEDLEERKLISLINPKGVSSSVGINSEGSSSNTNGSSYQTGKSLEKDCDISDNRKALAK